MIRPMGSKFWPKGGLPGVLHHYVRFVRLDIIRITY